VTGFPPPPDPSVLRSLDMEWIRDEGHLSHVVVSSRIRVARNLRGYRFPPGADPDELQRVLGEVVEATADSWFKGWHVVDSTRMSGLDLQMLVEKHLISPHHFRASAERAPGRGVILGPRGTLVAMVNEEDHLRMQCLLPGLDLERGWMLLSAMDDAFEQRLSYAFSDALGYLTACPSNLGTALRASVMLHLPALGLMNQMETVKQMIAGQVGLAVRGMFGEGTGVGGNLLQISNQISLGPTEEDLIEKVKSITLRIVDQEAAARDQLRREFAPQLADKVWRCLGILRHAQVVPAGEALELLSMVRLGVDLEILPVMPRPTLNELLVSIFPASLAVLEGEVSDSLQGDMIRARRIRQELAEKGTV